MLVAQLGAFPNDDQEAIRHGAARDGHFYDGPTRTAGYRRVRQASESLGVLLVLDDGSVACGEGVAVQYAGTGAREPVLDARAAADAFAGPVREAFAGVDVGSFRELSERLERLALPAAVAYGASQALLCAAASSARLTVAETVAGEYERGSALQPVPVLSQCGEDRFGAVDRMILRCVDALPHGLINNAELVGLEGEELARYVAWIRDRVLRYRDDPEYTPSLHIDCYGTIGEVFGTTDRCARYLAELEEIAAPFPLRIEQPIHAGSRTEQIAALVKLRQRLHAAGSAVGIVADEWCNTLDDVNAFIAGDAADMLQVKLPDVGGLDGAIHALLASRAAGVAAYCGGSCTETDHAARVATGVAMGVDANLLLARPGMGVDEAVMVVTNEMRRTLALVGARGAV
jgi:methylaspartate ammonia-lyase